MERQFKGMAVDRERLMDALDAEVALALDTDRPAIAVLRNAPVPKGADRLRSVLKYYLKRAAIANAITVDAVDGGRKVVRQTAPPLGKDDLHGSPPQGTGELQGSPSQGTDEFMSASLDSNQGGL